VLVVWRHRPRQRRHRRWHVAKIGDRWAALEPIRAGARLAFGAFAKDVARGLTVRSDWGPQYIADAFGNELAWLGITHSHSFVREPQCNGVIERFIRTLKEQCLWLHRFESLEEAREIIGAFIERYNHQWLIERLDHRTPAVGNRVRYGGSYSRRPNVVGPLFSQAAKSCLCGNRVRYTAFDFAASGADISIIEDVVLTWNTA
jgi:transposase InsO family protein